MYFETRSCSIVGMESRLVRVEADVVEGFPRFEIIGLADSAVKEASDRVRTAMRNGGIPFPLKRVTVNLAPAGFRKAGSAYDLAIAAAVLGAMGRIDGKVVENTAFFGELSLNSGIKGIAGALPMVCFLRDTGIKRIILPMENYNETRMVPGVEILPVENLPGAIANLRGNASKESIGGVPGAKRSDPLAPGATGSDLLARSHQPPDFSDVKGQLHARRAVEVAAAGRHHLMMMGPPGAGKTMIARRIPGILPEASFDEQLEISKIYSAAGLLDGDRSWIYNRPFRAPHHTTTLAGLSGGGRYPLPGEISLAHHGVLFLDELPEFKRHVTESLREPLEEGSISLVRSGISHQFPADFMMVASMNPCPCGYYPDRNRCTCSQPAIRNYLSKISGPLFDRIDIQVEVEGIPFDDLSDVKKGENSEQIRKRVLKAQKIQLERNQAFGASFNSSLPDKPEEWGWVEEGAKHLLESAFKALGLSARSYNKILKVARTIADLGGSETIREVHIAEAVGYRPLDRRFKGSDVL